jgi:hypothetical protein
MMKKRIAGFILIMVIALALGNFAFAADLTPALPDLKLSVQQSPLAVYPPFMIYTAQLSFMPPIISAQLVADFYNINPDSTGSSFLEYLGSVPFDKTGKAVLGKQIKPGVYTAVAKTVINGVTIWSNKVDYKVN